MSKYLYIFPHIQKTAGSTFRYHIRKNLKKDEWLLLDRKNLKIEGKLLNLNHKMLLDSSSKVIRSLNKKEKDKIKIIFGEWIPYGVHKFFPNRTPRYFTFVREPLSRTVSLYNHRRKIIEEESKNEIILVNTKKQLLLNGKILEFNKWLDIKFEPKNAVMSMYSYLKSAGYIKNGKNIDKLIKDGLDKFFFVGLVRTFSEDSLYLYNELGFKGFLFNQNISRKYYKLNGNKKKMKKELRKKISEDFILFQLAVNKNLDFKKKHTEFNKIVNKAKIKRRVILPFTQILYAPKDTVKLIGKKMLTFN